jgi:hypothetical protein
LKAGFSTIRAEEWEVPSGEEGDRELLISLHLYHQNMIEQLVPLERARMFEALMREFDIPPERLSEILEDETVESIRETLALLSIDDQVLEIVEHNPDRFTEAHLQLLAEYASPEKRSWRIKPQEQVQIAQTILDQRNKTLVKDTRKLDAHIRTVVKERRAKEKKKNDERKSQPDPVKTLFRALDGLDSAVRTLRDMDLRAIKKIDASDKGVALNRTYKVIGRPSPTMGLGN